MTTIAVEAFRLSPQQKSRWREISARPGVPFSVCAELRWEQAPSPQRLRRALAEVVAEHEILRTTFPRLQGLKLPAQAVREPSAPELSETDLATSDGDDSEARLAALLDELAAEPFDDDDPPLRGTFVRLPEGGASLLLALSPLVADACTLELVAADLARRLTAAPPAGESSEEPLQYAELAEWQNGLLEEAEAAEERRFWERWEGGEARTLWSRRRRGEPRVDSVAVPLSAGLADELERVGAEIDCAPRHLLLAAWACLLHRLDPRNAENGRLEVVSDGRKYAELRLAPGPLERRLPLALERASGSFAALAARLAERWEEARQWEEYLDPETPADEPRPWSFAWHALEAGPWSSGAGGLRLVRARGVPEPVQLELVCRRLGDRVEARLVYDGALYDGGDAAAMADQLATLLHHALAHPDTPIDRLPLVGTDERARLLAVAGEPLAAGDGDTLHALVTRAALRHPQRLAVAQGAERWTYGELAATSERLAGGLVAAGVAPGERVGVAMDRSPLCIAALLAVLRAGAAYVPLDTANPRRRLESMLRDLGRPRVLADAASLERLPAELCRPLDVEGLADADGAATTLPEVTQEHDAYVIFTSGSTGSPKGVVVPHRAVVNRLRWSQQRFPMDEADGLLQVAAVGFDFAVYEIFGTLSAGARLVLPAPGSPAVSRLVELVREEEVTVVHFVPTLLRLFLDEPGAERCSGLRRLYSGGEVLAPELAARCLEVLPATELVNQYGPTEATIDATFWPCPRDSAPATVPIGRPISNLRARVVDPALELAGIGVAGELVLGGAGLARGYAGRSAETAERFCPDPFTDEPGARLYRTGDLCRLRADGEIEYLGRLDQQVQLRGTRIELGEVEAALAAHPGVRAAAAAVRGEDGGDRLVAFVVAAGADAPDDDELRGFLRDRLPEYMLPAAFARLDALPLAASGKLDRAALTAVELQRPGAGGRYVAPRTPVERTIAAVWSEVLGVERVGVEDDFFALGGHSLLAMRIASRLRAALGTELALPMIFEHPTVAELADRLDGRPATTLPPLEAVDRDAPLALSSSQERLWFLQRMNPRDHSYNVAGAVVLRGDLEADALAAALGAVRRRHEVLRTVFPIRGGAPVQVVEPPGTTAGLPGVDLTALPEPRREPEMRRLARSWDRTPFDLLRGPVQRHALLRLAPQHHVLLLGMHHIVCDAWSTGILTRELVTLYRAGVRGEAVELPDLPVQYADYAAWQRRWLAGPQLDEHLQAVRRRLAGAPPAVDLPYDRPAGQPQGRGGRIERSVDPELAHRLEELARGEGASLYMVLLAAWGLLLSRYAGESTVVVGSPVANRQRTEIEPLIGCFINLVPLVVDLSGRPTFRDLLARCRTDALEAFAHQELPFEKLVEELRPLRERGRHPVFQVAFDLQSGGGGRPLELPDLRVESLDLAGGGAKFELLLTALDRGDDLSLLLEYDAGLFAAATAQRMLQRAVTLLAAAAATPDRPLAELPWLDAEERHHLLVAANAEPHTRDAAPPALLLARLATVVRRRGDEIAVQGDGWSLSFDELSRRAGAVSRLLRREGVGRGDRVAVLLQRGPQLLPALLGVLAAGAAYVPLDASYPPARMEWMLADSAASLLLTEEATAPRVPGRAPRRLRVESCSGTSAGLEAETSVLDGEDLAYVMYTSGSTGRPKGVMVPHRGLATYLDWAASRYLRGAGGAVLHSSLGFDLTVTSLFAPLLAGRPVHVAPTDGVGVEPLVETLRRQPHTALLKVTPSHLAMLRRHADLAPRVGTLVVGGEALYGEAADPWLADAPESLLVNEYGPTEATVGCIVEERTAADLEPGAVPIGRPIPHTRAYVLDRELRLSPGGVPGELHLAGDGLARGYHGRPSLTAERFLPDPFSHRAGQRMYRTGDRVRHLDDGRLLFLGRLDHQVKVRGHRVELGEVEAALRRLPGVGEAAATLHRSAAGEDVLVAYAVTETPVDSPPLDATALRSALAQELPEPLVPSQVVLVDAMPLDDHGKVDRARLPAPEAESQLQRGEAPATPPRNLLELQLLGVFEDVLGVDGLGVEDDFFLLGGHSLLAERLLTRVGDELGRHVPLSLFFEAPTVRGLAAAAVADPEAAASPLVALRSRGSRPPLYCVHPMGGDVLCLHPLSRHLGAEQPFYGLRAAHPSEMDDTPVTIPDMAARYVDAVSRAWPDGPCLLSGFSYGSAVAFEMAHQLRDAGREVALLALLDGRSPTSFQKAAERSDSVILAGLARELARESGGELHLPHDEVRRRDPVAAVEWILQRLRDEGLVSKQVDRAYLERFLDGVRRRLDAVRRYQPRIWDGDLHLFRSSSYDPESARAWLEVGIDIRDEDKGWGELTTRPVRVHRIPGHHATIIQEPEVAELASQLGRLVAGVLPATAGA